MAVPQSSRFHQLIRRLFSIKQSFDADVPESFLPTVELSHWYEIDRLRLADVKLVGGGLSQAAVAANFPQYIITAQPGTIVNIRRMCLQAAVTNQWRLTWAFGAFQPGGLGATQAQYFDGRDHRLVAGVQPVPAVFFSGAAVGVVPAAPALLEYISSVGAANPLGFFDVDITLFGPVIDPKQTLSTTNVWQLLITCENVNIATNMSWMGTMRHIEPSEQF